MKFIFAHPVAYISSEYGLSSYMVIRSRSREQKTSQLPIHALINCEDLLSVR